MPKRRTSDLGEPKRENFSLVEVFQKKKTAILRFNGRNIVSLDLHRKVVEAMGYRSVVVKEEVSIGDYHIYEQDLNQGQTWWDGGRDSDKRRGRCAA